MLPNNFPKGWRGISIIFEKLKGFIAILERFRVKKKFWKFWGQNEILGKIGVKI